MWVRSIQVTIRITDVHTGSEPGVRYRTIVYNGALVSIFYVLYPIPSIASVKQSEVICDRKKLMVMSSAIAMAESVTCNTI